MSSVRSGPVEFCRMAGAVRRIQRTVDTRPSSDTTYTRCVNQASRFRVRVLGPIVVESSAGDLVEPGGATSKALVVCLALSHGPRSLRGIVDDIWQDAPPRNERAALQTLVSRVRSVASADLIASTPGGYALGVGPEECDLTAVRRARDAGRAEAERADWSALADRTAVALDLWRGEPGADLGDTELAARLADLTAELHRDLTVLHARALLADGAGADALSGLAPLVEADPLNEEVELLRLRAIASSSTRNDALREFERFRRRLRDELGSDPSAELMGLQAELLRASGTESRRSILRVGLRAAPNALLGRDADVAALEQMMGSGRLTTILGAGGLGKTRIAQELAARAADRIPGVVVVELAGVRTGDDLALALASILGIGDHARGRAGLRDAAVQIDVRTRILQALGERETLLVVDNCEHIVDAVARWVDDILSATRSVRVLATSRAPLMIAAERVYQLPALPSSAEDGGQGPAVRLFIERARAARPMASLPVGIVARLCDRLDGLPLAIELAAARVRSMSVEEIERRIGDRFALLRGGDRTAPARHRTLLAVIDWSWNLLSTSEQRSLRRLSVFADGFGAAAARAVADSDDIDADLEGLVNQSLLTASDVPSTGHVRYRMLETVREFTGHLLERSGEEQDAIARVRGWIDAFSRNALRTTFGPDQVAAFQAVEGEQDNLVEVLHRALEEGDAAVTASVFATLGLHWTIRGAHSEVMTLAPQVLQALRGYRPDADHRDQTVLALGLVGATAMIDDVRTGLRALVRMRALVGRRPPENPQLAAMVELMAALPHLSRLVAVAERQCRSEFPAVSAIAHLLVSQAAENSGDFERALTEGLAAHQRAVAAQDTWTIGTAAQNLSSLYSEVGRPERTREWVDRCRPHLEKLNIGEDLTQLDWIEAMNGVALGHLEEAEAVFRRLAVSEGPVENADLERAGFRAIGYVGLAEVAAAEGDLARWKEQYVRAERVWGSASVGSGSWWYYGAASGVLVSSAATSTAQEAEVRRIARRVRRRLILSDRLRPAGMIDRPMTGLAALGLAVWLLAPEREEDSQLRRTAQEMLVLAHAVGARQDFPSLSRARIADLVEGWYPDIDLAAAARRTEEMTMAERGDRLTDLLRSVRIDL